VLVKQQQDLAVRHEAPVLHLRGRGGEGQIR
jgi:hypothetical protein